jgi:hypothetical protein
MAFVTCWLVRTICLLWYHRTTEHGRLFSSFVVGKRLGNQWNHMDDLRIQ